MMSRLEFGLHLIVIALLMLLIVNVYGTFTFGSLCSLLISYGIGVTIGGICEFIGIFYNPFKKRK